LIIFVKHPLGLEFAEAIYQGKKKLRKPKENVVEQNKIFKVEGGLNPVN
jgi:hypothetical protein